MSNFAAGLNELKDMDKTKPDPEFQVNINNGMTFGVAPMQRTRIQMDTSKAMAILGFSSSQTFEATKLDEIEKAFLRRMDVLLKQKKKRSLIQKMQREGESGRKRLNQWTRLLTIAITLVQAPSYITFTYISFCLHIDINIPQIGKE